MGPELNNPDARYPYKCGDCGDTSVLTIAQMGEHRQTHK
jgi:hypothetical protein